MYGKIDDKFPPAILPFKTLPENLAEHELVLAFTQKYDESWQALVFPYLAFLIQSNDLTEANQLVAFVQDMSEFSHAKEIVAYHLAEAIWSEKYGTNFRLIVMHCKLVLEDGVDKLVATILHDEVAVKSWIRLCFIMPEYARKILLSCVSNEDKCKFLKSALIGSFHPTFGTNENGFTTGISSLFVIEKDGEGSTKIGSKYYGSVDKTIESKKYFHTIIDVANQNPNFVEELLAVLIFFTKKQEERFFSVLKTQIHKAEAYLYLFRQCLRAETFNVDTYLEYLANTDKSEVIISMANFCALLQKQTMTVLRLRNARSQAVKKTKDIQDKIDTLRSRENKKIDTGAQMASLNRQLMWSKSNWTALPLQSAENIMDFVNATLVNDLELARYLFDMAGVIFDTNSDKTLIHSLFFLADKNRVQAINLCRLLYLEQPANRPIILKKLFCVIENSEPLFDRLVLLGARAPTVYYGFLLVNAFYQVENLVRVDRLQGVLDWMSHNPRAALQLSSFLLHVEPKDKAAMEILAELILVTPDKFTKMLVTTRGVPTGAILYSSYLLQRYHREYFIKQIQQLIVSAKKENILLPSHSSESFNLEDVFSNPDISPHALDIIHFYLVADQQFYLKKILRLYEVDAELAEQLLIFGYECSDINLAIKILDLINRPIASPFTIQQLKDLLFVCNYEVISGALYLKDHARQIPNSVPVLKKLKNTDMIDHKVPSDLQEIIFTLVRGYSVKEKTIGQATLTEGEWVELRNEINRYATVQKVTVFKSEAVQVALSNFLASVVARVLLSDDGNLNVSLIPEIKEKLLAGYLEKTSFTLFLSSSCDNLFNDHELQEYLANLRLPDALPTQSTEIIRITLGLGHDAVVSTVDFKRVILTALLMHVRQGMTVGSCAGTNRVVSCKTDLMRTAKLITRALSDNKVSVQPAKHLQSIDIRFIYTLNSSELNDNVYFKPNGELQGLEQEGLKLWHIPAWYRLANFLSIEPYIRKSWVLYTISKRKNNFRIASAYPLVYCTTKREMLRLLVEESQFSNEVSTIIEEGMIHRSQNAYLAEMQNPIIRLLESIMLGGDNTNQITVQNCFVQPFKHIAKLSINLTLEGKISDNGGTKSPLWRSPLIRAVCHLFGIPEGQETADMVVGTLKMLVKQADEKKVPLVSISLKEMLDALCIYISTVTVGKKTLPSTEDIYLALFKKYRNINLTILETIKFSFCGAVSEVEFNPLIVLFFPNREYDITLVKLVDAALQSIIMHGNDYFSRVLYQIKEGVQRRIGVRYNHDDSAINNLIGNNGHESEGRMVLVDAENFDELRPAFIRSDSEFSTLCTSIIDTACDAALAFVSDCDEPMKRAFMQFASSKIMVDMIGKTFQNISGGKPWEMTKGARGGLTWQYSVDTKNNTRFASYSFHPRNASDILTHLVSYGSTRGMRFNAFNYLGSTIPGHGISMTLGHPSFHPIWRAPNREKWIQENLFEKSEKLSCIQLSEEKIQQFISMCAEKLQPIERQAFFEKCRTIENGVTLFDLRHKMMSVIEEIMGSVTQAKEVEWKIDTQLITILTADQRADLTVIHIADSNWLNERDHQDIHFCLLVSPLTREVEMWRCNQDGTALQKEKQDNWICEKRWDICSVY